MAGQHPVPDPADLQQAMDIDDAFLAPGWPDHQAAAGSVAQPQPPPQATDAGQAPVDPAAAAAAEKGASRSERWCALFLLDLDIKGSNGSGMTTDLQVDHCSAAAGCHLLQPNSHLHVYFIRVHTQDL